MSICISSLKTKPIPVCISILTVGEINDSAQNVFVFIKDITTGRIETNESTSDLNGIVSIDASDYPFLDSHSYELWITKQSKPYYNLDITIDGATDTIVFITCNKLYGTLFVNSTLQADV